MSRDDPGRCRERFDGANSFLEPPSKFGGPILELVVDAEIMGPVLCDVGIELGLPADRDEIGLAIPQDRFSLLCLDQVVNNAATLRHMSGGQLSVPMVVRMATGAGRQLAAQHSHSLERWSGDQGARPGDRGRRAWHAARRPPRARPGLYLRACGAVSNGGRPRSGAQLRVISVLEPPPQVPGAPSHHAAEYFNVLEERVIQHLWPLVKTRDVEKFVRYGMPVDLIKQEAAAWAADLVVVGSHGKDWVDRLLIGSVTERLLNNLPTSLLVVPTHAHVKTHDPALVDAKGTAQRRAFA